MLFIQLWNIVSKWKVCWNCFDYLPKGENIYNLFCSYFTFLEILRISDL